MSKSKRKNTRYKNIQNLIDEIRSKKDFFRNRIRGQKKLLALSKR